MERQERSVKSSSAYFKRDKTVFSEYEIIRLLVHSLRSTAFVDLSDAEKNNLTKLYRELSPQISSLPLFELLNYMLWNDEGAPLHLRDKTKFFSLVSNWIVEFELNVVKVEGSIRSQYKFIRQFFEKETNNTFQRVILFEEIVDDLHDLIEGVFWDFEKSSTYIITKEDLSEIVKFLALLSYPHSVFLQQKGPYQNSIMQQILEFCGRYEAFMIKAFDFILKAPEINRQAKVLRGNSELTAVSATKSLLDDSYQMELTRIILLFLQRPDLAGQQIIGIVKSVMVHTSKPVRYAMILEYVKFYDYLQQINHSEVLEALEDIVYFRELVIGSNQISEAGLLVHPLATIFNHVEVLPGRKQRIYLSHEKQYGFSSILQIEVMLEHGDITLIIWQIGGGGETEYWRENRTEDRRVDILLNKEGLYALQLNNQYSWVKAKRISYKIEQYSQCPQQSTVQQSTVQQ